MEEMKHGILKDSKGHPFKKANKKIAEEEAYRRWKEAYTEDMIQVFEQRLDKEEQERKKAEKRKAVKMERKRLRHEARQKRLAERLKKKQEVIRREKQKVMAEERKKKYSGSLKILNFERAVVGPPDHFNCEHLKAKAWGTLYGKGLRCVKCGKELSDLFLEENQQKGIGSGEDTKLVDMVVRHRANSPTFHFHSGEELEQVERERRRLEKERREMKEEDTCFYDMEDIKAIYEFDRRHKTFLKEHNIFRQGVQWTMPEVGRWKQDQQDYYNSLTPRTRAKKRLEFEDFMYEREPLPTFRHYDFVRKKAYQEMMFFFARINNCRIRIMELKSLRVALMVKRKEQGSQADYVHSKLVDLEKLLGLYEKAIDHVDRLIQKRERADRDWRSAKELLITADVDKKKAEMDCVGLEDIVKESQRIVKLRTAEVKTVLRQKIIMGREVQRITENIAATTTRAAKLRKDMEDNEVKVEVMQYYKKNASVPTPYGVGKVVVYRDEDNIVVVQVGDRKVYMPPEKFLHLDRAKQQACRVEMAEEERQQRAWYEKERAAREEETALMAEEDRITMEAMTYEREVDGERAYMCEALADEEQEAWKALDTPQMKALLNQKVDHIVERAMQPPEGAQTNNANVKDGKKGKKPPLTKEEEEKKQALKQQTLKKLTEDYISERIMLRRLATRTFLEKKAYLKAEAASLDYIFETMMHDFMYEVADEQLRVGYEAKVRVQVESGIIFMDPPHMQFTVYNTLKKQWVQRRDYLRNNIELMMIKSSKSMEAFAAEEAIFKKLNESLEERERREAEEKRQNDLNSAMRAEEEYSRQFYREELLLTLRERRMMAQEERYMRMYILMLKHIEEMKKKQPPVVKGEKVPEGLTRNELRRLELKKQAVERIKEEKEGEQMVLEDKRSAELRSYYRVLEAKKKLEEEGIFVEGYDGESDGEESVVIDPLEDAEIIPDLPEPIQEMNREEIDSMIQEGGKTASEVQMAVHQRHMQIIKRRRRIRVS